MERDKIIEEMTTNGLCCIACEMCDETQENGKFVEAQCLESGCTNNCSLSKHVAEAFIDAGYRKIPDGAVVLTQEMAYKYREDLAKVKFLKGEIRKETAKEILQKIWEKSTSYDEYFDANGEECLGITWEGLAREEFEKIKEKYGVEVE